MSTCTFVDTQQTQTNNKKHFTNLYFFNFNKMKKVNYFLALAVMTVIAFASCSSDDLVADGDKSSNGAKMYTQVRLYLGGIGSASRAGVDEVDKNFQYGTDAENKINTLWLAFYSKEGTYLDAVEVSGNLISSTQNPSGNNVALEQLYEVEVTENIASNANQLVAYVNCDESEETAPSLSATLSTTIDDYKSDNGFIMTNSAYYKGTEEVKAVAVSDANFYKTNETPGTIAEIYVERVAAKIEVKGPATENISDYVVYAPNVEEVKLTFVPGKWFPQSAAKDAYLIKKLVADNTLGWLANAAGNHRNYWAEAVNYNGAANTARNANLTYLSYAAGVDAGKDLDGYTYVQENTMPATRLYIPGEGENAGTQISAYNPWYDVTTAIISGSYKYEANADKGIKGADEDGTFYLRSGVVVTSSDVTTDDGTTTTTTTKKGYFIYNTEEAIDKMLEDAGVKVAMPEGFKLSSIFELALGENVGQTSHQNEAKLQLAVSAVPEGVTITVNSVKVDETNITTLLVPAISKVSPMLKYEKGQAYFAVPLKHYVSPEDNASPANTNPYIELSKVKTGNYGIVRNNWYELTINKISGLATGVGSETTTEPTVDPDPENWMIDVVLRVLQWHMRSQSVDL